mgnify:FL=1
MPLSPRDAKPKRTYDRVWRPPVAVLRSVSDWTNADWDMLFGKDRDKDKGRLRRP